MNSLFHKKSKKFIFLKDLYKIFNLPYPNKIKKKILGVNNIKDAKNFEITYLNSTNYIKDAIESNALVCIVSEQLKKYLNKMIIPIVTQQPEIDFYKVVSIFYPSSNIDDEKIIPNKYKKYIKKNIIIGNNTLIDKTVKIGKNVKIGNNVIIKPHVKIGNGCVIGSNVIISNALIGDNVIIKSGTLIGQTGFGFKYLDKTRLNFPHIGRVVLENNCQIGSLCTIDRGTLSDTVVGEFTTIDNQVQIAHNVKIGSFCIIASQVGIAGSTIIGNNVLIGGQAGISHHLKIGNYVKIGGKSGVVSSIGDNQIVMGYPAKSLREFVKQNKK